jgi:hypothetical protein
MWAVSIILQPIHRTAYNADAASIVSSELETLGLVSPKYGYSRDMGLAALIRIKSRANALALRRMSYKVFRKPFFARNSTLIVLSRRI